MVNLEYRARDTTARPAEQLIKLEIPMEIRIDGFFLLFFLCPTIDHLLIRSKVNQL